jgi:hypothetical protein
MAPQAEPEPAPVALPEPVPAAAPDAAAPAPASAPSVATFGPEQSHWGATVTITGTDLRGADASLSVGDELTITPNDATYVLSWTEDRIEFRIPFPHQGPVTVTTGAGSVPAGSFQSEWAPGTPYASADLAVAASVAWAPGSLALAFESASALVASYDGDIWVESELTAPEPLLAGSLRLYTTQGGELAAFGLGQARELWTFSGASSWSAEETGFAVQEEAALAGGPEGGVVWQLTAQGWQRLHSGPDGWVVDAGPAADPGSSLPDRAVAATSAGSLIVAYSADTGNFLDDLGAPYFYQLSDGETEFEGPLVGGSSVDDYLTSLALVDRGRGFLVEYCGSDVDPLSLSGTDHRCYSAAHSDRGAEDLSALREADGARYAFTQQDVAVAYCDDSDQTRVTRDDRATDPGKVATWPCAEIASLEIDPRGDFVLLARLDGELIPLRYIGGSLPPTTADAGLPTPSDAGTEMLRDGGSDAGSPRTR